MVVWSMTDGGLVNNDQVPDYRTSGGTRRIRPLRRAKWTEIAVSTFLVLIVSIPVMVVEEDWHGRPMIDEGTYLWILPAFLVASAFLFGGALAGFRGPSAAVAHAVSAAGLALAI